VPATPPPGPIADVPAKPRGVKRQKRERRGAQVASSYVLFCTAYQKANASDLAGLSFGDRSRACQAAWKALATEERARFSDQSRDMRAEKAALNPANAREKKPPSAYILFSVQERKRIVAECPTLTLGEVSKQCGQVWRQMTAEQRQAWGQPVLVDAAATSTQREE